MTARTIALSALMVELCSTCPLFAAAPVALSLTNAADYISTVPINTNLIQGIGMGPDGAYRTLRAEDAEFLFSALSERLLLAAEPFPGLTANTWMQAGRVPLAQYDSISLVWTNDFRVTYNEGAFDSGAEIYSEPSLSYGFVPASWQPWTGYLKITGTNGWERNGYDAATDIRAVFDSTGSAGIATNSIPTNIVFSGATDLATVTNSYALIDGDLLSCLLRSNAPTPASVTTNDDSLVYHIQNVSNVFTRYTVDGWSGQYLSSVVLLDWFDYTNRTKSVVGPAMSCYSSRSVLYSTNYGVEYSRAPTVGDTHPGGTVHIAAGPFKYSETFEESLPGDGGSFYVRIGVACGLTPDNRRIVNTNLVVDAYLICCWRCTTTDTFFSAAIPEGRDAVSSSSNQVTRLLSSHSLGSLSFDSFVTNSFPIDVWVSSAVVADIQETALTYASASRCFASPFFWQPVPPYFAVDPSEIPSTVTNSWTASNNSSATAIATRRNDFTADTVYLLLLVRPTYHARVLGPASQ